MPAPKLVVINRLDVDLRVQWLGHATVDLRLAGIRILTDPLLRDRVLHLRRYGPPGTLDPGTVDVVLISHLHHDHLDLPSLRQLAGDIPLLVPSGAGRVIGSAVRNDITEMAVGDTCTVGGVKITVVPAAHRSGRFLRRTSASPVGYLLQETSTTVYFPGDTDLHPVMSDLPSPDLALLPIGGWGRTLGPGHLDPQRAARAASLLGARSVLPIHWGTFAPMRGLPGPPRWLNRPAERFRMSLREHSPDTELLLVAPGSSAVTVASRTAGVPSTSTRLRSPQELASGPEDS